MVYITRQIAQSSDDCYRRLAISYWALDDPTAFAGDYSISYYDYRAGFRFLNITVPKGVNIISAYLKLYAHYIYNAIPTTIIEGEASDNAATFSTAADYDARPRTSASVSWTPESWIPDTWYTSVDIKAIIQEIVNRNGWVSGNALVLFWRDADEWGGTQKLIGSQSYDMNPSFAAILEITHATVHKQTVTEILGMVDTVIKRADLKQTVTEKLGMVDVILFRYKLWGHTFDANANLLSDCVVWLFKTSDKSFVDETVSDENGYYEFPVPDDVTEYFIRAYKDGVPNIFGTTHRDLKGHFV